MNDDSLPSNGFLEDPVHNLIAAALASTSWYAFTSLLVSSVRFLLVPSSFWWSLPLRCLTSTSLSDFAGKGHCLDE